MRDGKRGRWEGRRGGLASNRTVRLVAGGELAVELVENGVHFGFQIEGKVFHGG